MYRVQHWLGHCDSNHKCAPILPELPTRVLDLGEAPYPEQIKLVETKGRNGRYIALSHCWGSSHRITTTQSTLEARKRGISIAELPSTFQQAALIAVSLGVTYLWIDSLCIVQDSHSDWEYEASRMGSVYANSYLTIAASSSLDDSSGCFPSLEAKDSPYLPPEAASMSFNVAANIGPYVVFRNNSDSPTYLTKGMFAVFTGKTDSEDAKPSTLFFTKEWMPSSSKQTPRIYSIGTFGSSFDPLAKQPLNTRAWTLQERILAPRTIHFASDQMFWVCKHCMLTEDGCRFASSGPSQPFATMESLLTGQRIPFHHHGLPRNPERTKSSYDAIHKLSPGMSDYFMIGDDFLLHNFETLYYNVPKIGRWKHGWLWLVGEYSRRKLTYAADKLSALSGLAGLLAKETKDTYLAGIWANHLPEDLFWRVYAREEMIQVKPGEGLVKEQCYGEVLSGISKPETYRAPTWSWASIDANIMFIQLNFDHVVSECVDHHIEPSGNDKFGRVKSGWIKIRVCLYVPKSSFPG
jgi:Heterokaryon incompatibility protein (HET)